MSYNVQGTTITLTRGDTFMALISITQSDGNPYVPNEGDNEVDIGFGRHKDATVW